MPFSVGDFVGVPVQYTRGAFDNELLVSLNYSNQMISGFVQRHNLRFLDDRRALLKAEVLDSEGEVRLKLFGSFFTTNGVEPFSTDWARENLQLLEAA